MKDAARVLDFEKAAIGNPMIDAVTTLEDPKNGNVNREKIFREVYLRGYGILEREFLEESYQPHAVFVSACQVGSKTNQGDIKRAKGFARNVIKKSSSRVKDSFVKYLRSIEGEKARELQKIL
jgi:aminoglycoside phosphotransferase (APT) family kinase protein